MAVADEVRTMVGVDAAATHSWQLHDEIDWVLRKLDRRLDQISVFGVTTGPGSFTGVRVGLATVKGLAHALDKPVVGVSTLEAQARSAGVSGLVCACIDALRGEVYAQLFRIDQDGSVQSLWEPRLAMPTHVYASLSDEPQVTFVGDGVLSSLDGLQRQATIAQREVIFSPLVHRAVQGWHVVPASPFLAPAVASLTNVRVQQGHTQSASEVTALYVRASDAEVKRRNK